MIKRGSGVLLHITSLPSPYGVGDLGSSAYRFADFLSETKQNCWQILPLNPTDPIYSNSPYQSISAFANNPLLLSPELMVEDGLLLKSEIEPPPRFPEDRVDYEAALTYKKRLFDLAFERFQNKKQGEEYERFCLENSFWLDDFSLFVVLKSHFNGKVWGRWQKEVRDRDSKALETLKKEFHERIEKEKFLQFIFFNQWFRLKGYCNKLGIHIFGDIPIYTVYDSADVWKNPEIFKLDSEGKPSFVAGVPPDYFSQTGQLWGNPVYRWEVLKERDYDWWVQRIQYNLKIFDLVRIDHFRGFVAYWEVAADETTAMNGKWIEAPAMDFFNQLKRKLPSLPIIAEDLGVITPDVIEVMRHFNLPGMKVLLFAFDEYFPKNPYLPHNLERNCVLYTGTHDNNTIQGWFTREATPEIKKRLFRYLGREAALNEIHWDLIRLAMMSVADMVIFPMQDILGLGEESRMNRPATNKGNWKWRLLSHQLTPELSKRLLEMTETFGRTPG